MYKKVDCEVFVDLEKGLPSYGQSEAERNEENMVKAFTHIIVPGASFLLLFIYIFAGYNGDFLMQLHALCGLTFSEMFVIVFKIYFSKEEDMTVKDVKRIVRYFTSLILLGMLCRTIRIVTLEGY